MGERDEGLDWVPLQGKERRGSQLLQQLVQLWAGASSRPASGSRRCPGWGGSSAPGRQGALQARGCRATGCARPGPGGFREKAAWPEEQPGCPCPVTPPPPAENPDIHNVLLGNGV